MVVLIRKVDQAIKKACSPQRLARGRCVRRAHVTDITGVFKKHVLSNTFCCSSICFVLSCFGARDGIQGLVHAKQAFYG